MKKMISIGTVAAAVTISSMFLVGCGSSCSDDTTAPPVALLTAPLPQIQASVVDYVETKGLTLTFTENSKTCFNNKDLNLSMDVSVDYTLNPVDFNSTTAEACAQDFTKDFSIEVAPRLAKVEGGKSLAEEIGDTPLKGVKGKKVNIFSTLAIAKGIANFEQIDINSNDVSPDLLAIKYLIQTKLLAKESIDTLKTIDLDIVNNLSKGGNLPTGFEVGGVTLAEINAISELIKTAITSAKANTTTTTSFSAALTAAMSTTLTKDVVTTAVTTANPSSTFSATLTTAITNAETIKEELANTTTPDTNTTTPDTNTTTPDTNTTTPDTNTTTPDTNTTTPDTNTTTPDTNTTTPDLSIPKITLGTTITIGGQEVVLTNGTFIAEINTGNHTIQDYYTMSINEINVTKEFPAQDVNFSISINDNDSLDGLTFTVEGAVLSYNAAVTGKVVVTIPVGATVTLQAKGAVDFSSAGIPNPGVTTVTKELANNGLTINMQDILDSLNYSSTQITDAEAIMTDYLQKANTYNVVLKMEGINPLELDTAFTQITGTTTVL